ncbi:MAG: hypothetical protein GXO90_03640 [FCB group bacterium]|nr:hypothetical protein [FCB group bacterium]
MKLNSIILGIVCITVIKANDNVDYLLEPIIEFSKIIAEEPEPILYQYKDENHPYFTQNNIVNKYGLRATMRIDGKIRNIISLKVSTSYYSPLVNNDSSIQLKNYAFNQNDIGLSTGFEYPLGNVFLSFISVNGIKSKIELIETRTYYLSPHGYNEEITKKVRTKIDKYFFNLEMGFKYIFHKKVELQIGVQYYLNPFNHDIVYALSDPETENPFVVYSHVSQNKFIQFIGCSFVF